MKKILFLAALLLIGLEANAQETYLYAERDTCALKLDIFRPTEGAETSFQGIQKPTIVFVFGGGFIMGQRTDDFTRRWFQLLNDNGYGVVTIDYRLGMKGQKVGKGLVGAYKAADLFYNAQQMGVEDLFSAISFLHDNQEELEIDTGNLVLAGSSAGAIISLAAEYDIACGRTEGLPEGFNFKGVMSFAGAIISMDGTPKFKQSPCPILLLHGTADKAVAYKGLNAFGRGLWGSYSIDQKLDRQGAEHSFYRFKDRKHDVAAYMEAVWPLEKDFLERSVMLKESRMVDQVIDDPSLPTWQEVSLKSIYQR